MIMAGGLDDLTITPPDFRKTIAADQVSNFQVHLLLHGGEAGHALVLQDVVVCGGLCLSPNVKMDFYTTVYRSEVVSETVIVPVVRNMAVSQRVNSVSTCVTGDGHVGILDITFRIISQAGNRGRIWQELKDAVLSPVTEVLTL
ncbi:hypothetical protein LY78DRAFT_717137 [Colletotrichum sublineola]|nr:hypothetical protein LY78DRAFT_717137 [Colletotrichum sublineola]